VEVGAEMSNVVPLRYVARAGLLPELTRQTYDSLYKSLREVILNSVDAGATRVVVDLSAVEEERTLEITDDGAGMTLGELQQSFMSLGGSQKFGKSDKFGRIGIGSLALMHYAQGVEIETTKAGSRSVTKARISHPWALDQTQRAQDLGDFRAGDAWQEKRSTATSAHYTTIRLHGVDELLVGECADIGSYYKLIDRLRRILPLRWQETRLSGQLEQVSPELVSLVREHADDFCAEVFVRSKWSGEELLTKRIYGDGGVQEEEWNGKPRAILKDVVVDDAAGSRVIRIAGYLLSQVRPSIEWSGLTARVQNVAVEERSFFDLESDPGFRKYIAGEVWLLGEADRTRLINIDRASFNRESGDYRAIARAMQAEIVKFKAERVQAPQRAKVAIKRRLDQQVALIDTARRLSAAITARSDEPDARAPFPSSNNGSIRATRARGLLDDLQELGAVAAVEPAEPGRGQPYRLRTASDGQRVLVEVSSDLVNPKLAFAGVPYSLRLVEGPPNDPPMIVKNRPRELVFNLAHEVFGGQIRQAALEMVMALEFAYLLGASEGEEALYDRVLALVSAQ
jgi:Histidine kinase-, DNA gyrase B-, and HSP90-like ATPase